MQATPLFYPPLKNPNPLYFRYSSTFSTKPPLPHLGFPRFPSKVHRFIKNCIVSSHELSHLDTEITAQNGGFPLCDRVNEGEDDKMLGTQSLWSQIKEIVMFTGPATGLWICGPLMSLIDTAVIGQGSSIELAALGPGTVLCDYMSYVFMFLSVATSNMVATSLAREDKNEVQHQISVLLFVGLTGGLFMLFFTKFFGSWALTAFTGPNNAHIVPAANTYVQVVAGYMMITSLNKKGYNAYTICIPSLDDLQTIFGLAAPVFIMMMAKVAFYALIIYFATNMGTHTAAAHQVMIQTYCMCTVWGEPLSQTAQSFMPELLYGINKNLLKARMLLKSLVIIGASLGLILGIVGTSVPWLFPNIFTSDRKVIHEMHKVLAPYFVALAVTPATHSLEGTLLVW
ncbi:hypothetical protein Godav_014555 [Gossypium davidsonii]|uniref:Protein DETOXIFICATION n=1 Tax=Gossypium davidsonii TaxID=34287 RepID=A0A7J8RK78_GOSDV|nr:hypothetical protein [Gossypium davidsonii]